ncbi:MAG TPA: TlpA disulfide reductase family protein [Chitinophagaceae bacterium]|nr:TlpA disulfide reductase family protein [Chitinophagaceae bacterium]
MKKIIVSAAIILSGKFSLAQESIFSCYDTLFNHLLNDSVGHVDFMKPWQDCIRGKQMPDFSVETITGERIETHQFRGKVLVINLWYMACAPCMAEMPALNSLVTEYRGKDVVFVAFGTDSKSKLVAEFLPNYKFDFIIVPYDKVVLQKIGKTGFPTTYIIDKKGNVRMAWAGGPTGKEAETEAYLKAKPVIDELIKEKDE